ncbi:MAG TPA: hypothetical protein VMM12_01270 [Longimicrobiales bacterium]|nr:hypothetical protein [Longimicrobiales bacterium]
MTTRIAALALAALLAPAGVAAQQAGGWWAPVAEQLPATNERPGLVCSIAPDLPACRGDAAREGDREAQRRDRDAAGRAGRDDGRRVEGRRGNGPPFCRNGQGHPVHGRQWCRDKGWDQGGWSDVTWGDVILGPRERTRDGERLDRGALADVLGDVVLRRLDAHARTVNGGPLEGRFVDGRTRVLQVRAGDVPLAELLDANRDGRIDRILVLTPR